MATEAAVDKLADAPASESQPAPDAHNVDLDRPTVNGTATPSDDIENKHITSVEDQVNSADVSVSGGSDTEASRADGSKSKDGDKGHGRTGSSVKKPATFKAVSVNKTFLAAKANANSSVTKAADKPPSGPGTPPTGSATLSGRPRLVAKSGSGAGGSFTRSSSANGGKAPSAPDASVVWNKNRPVPPPEPKKFTDEELKKYGIHMASRLEEDDDKGQNKWADIDDDDDDWAPEAITWGDGTKTTLPHPDEHPAPLSDAGSVASKGKIVLDKPRSPAPPLVGSPLPKSSGLASGKGLVLKSGSQDKPTLVAKPPAPPTPVKSPWAPLPPVEKASPIPADAHLVRGGVNQPLPPNRMNHQLREIAPDDFSRSSWRDGPSQGNRELYNAHSGRYEPVPDRRGSMRQEQHQKPHALLQRPSQSDYPEPSGAFQTNRVTQEAPFGRRRGSSNVSGGSGQYYQRMVKGNEGPMPPHEHRGPEHLGARRTSFASSAVESPVSPGNLSVQPHQPAWSRPSPRQAFAAVHQAGPSPAGPPQAGPLPEAVMGPPPPVLPVVDELEYQKKLMREKVELARKRRQEEEAREEAERKERIRQKLEAMGPPPEKKSDKKDSPKVESSKPTQIQQRELSKDSTQSSNQPQQDSGKGSAAAGDETPEREAKATSPAKPTPAQPGNRRASQSQELKPAVLWGNASASRQERLGSWGPPQQAARPGNVWGAPNNDRGLGNGTFITDLGRLTADSSAAAPGTKGASPIAPPNTGTRAPSQGRHQPPAPIGSRTSSRYGAPASDLASKWAGGVSENDKKLTAERIAERADRERQLAERGLTLEDAQPVIKDTWRQVHAPGDATRRSVGTTETQTHQHGWKASADELVKSSPQDDLPLAPNAGVIGSGSGSILSQAGKGTPSQGRGSRFFPSRDVRLENSAPADPTRSKSPTPPPPTMEGHPAYEGDINRPHVSLPKPQPIVKLPPAMGGPQPSQARPQFGWAHSAPYKDARAPINPNRPPTRAGEASQEKWQSRINSLLNGQRSPPQKSIVVDAASKSALDHAPHHDSATVSLPISPHPGRISPRPLSNPILTNRGSPISKPMAEECFEEQEMGSLPQIRLPHKAPEAAWQPAEASEKYLPKTLRVQPAAVEPYYFRPDVTGGGNAMTIHFPGMVESRLVTIPFSATRGRGSSIRGGPRHRGSGYERRGGKREVSNTRGDHGTSSSGPRGRGGYRGRGSDSWSRHSATPPSLPA
ncbi:Fc.00g085700.m01.CDS01 [Cosmosporella sp. VM-42]